MKWNLSTGLLLRLFFQKLLFISLGLGSSAPLFADATPAHIPNVVVSIVPFHALVSAVMDNVAKPTLLVKTGASPHHYTLRPSEIKALQNADVIVWGGPSLESFLTKPLSTLPKTTHVIELDNTPSLSLLPVRRSAHFEHCCEHNHDTPQAQSHTKTHTHGKHSPTPTQHHGSSLSGTHVYDMHFWLDPDNAKLLVDEISNTLAKIDPAHKDHYFKNAKKFKTKLTQLDAELRKKLHPIQNKPFIVFHDAYQYFERHYHLMSVGAISLHPEIPPSIERMNEIRQIIKTTKAVCIFKEPQFQSKLVYTLAEETGVHVGVLDPLGPIEENTTDAYFKLLESLTNALVQCLGHS